MAKKSTSPPENNAVVTLLCLAEDRARWQDLEEGFAQRGWNTVFIEPHTLAQVPGQHATPPAQTPHYHAVLVDHGLSLPWGQPYTTNVLRGLCPGLPVVAVARFCGSEVVDAAATSGANTLIGHYASDEEWQELEYLVEGSSQYAHPITLPCNVHGLVTQDAAMIDCIHKAQRLSGTNASVLLNGPTGVGKEMLARVLHGAQSPDKPFVDVNCAALPEHLVESELFGYKKGAFSGAFADSEGLIRSAHGGTLFLDEVGELPRHIQIKLLRTLETGEVRPVGSDRVFKSNFRIIAATHKDLNAAVASGNFKADLLYRIGAITLSLPPLDDRPADITLLAQHFLHHFHAKDQCQASTFSAEALQTLASTPWPGNVRELKNFVQRCAASCASPVVPEVVVCRLLQGQVVSSNLAIAQYVFESDQLSLALSLSGGAVSGAAKLLKKNRTELYRLLKSHAISDGSPLPDGI